MIPGLSAAKDFVAQEIYKSEIPNVYAEFLLA